jgi:hypothetical protein
MAPTEEELRAYIKSYIRAPKTTERKALDKELEDQGKKSKVPQALLDKWEHRDAVLQNVLDYMDGKLIGGIVHEHNGIPSEDLPNEEENRDNDT